jgi:hypothetical protein
MARPEPKVELKHIDDARLETNVIYADSIWVVCYKGYPITVRRGPADFNYPGFKYLKNAWPHPGHAFNQAERLNEMFATDQFTVWEMRPYKKVEEYKKPPRKEIDETWTPTKYSADEIIPKPGKPNVKPIR